MAAVFTKDPMRGHYVYREADHRHGFQIRWCCEKCGDVQNQAARADAIQLPAEIELKCRKCHEKQMVRHER